jgi:hypothetical protein
MAPTAFYHRPVSSRNSGAPPDGKIGTGRSKWGQAQKSGEKIFEKFSKKGLH